MYAAYLNICAIYMLPICYLYDSYMLFPLGFDIVPVSHLRAARVFVTATLTNQHNTTGPPGGDHTLGDGGRPGTYTDMHVYVHVGVCLRVM